MEAYMSVIEGMNIVDDALNLALAALESRGMKKDDAQIALLIRLRGVVPAEVSRIADMLCDDPEVAAAINETNAVENTQSKTA
jgi:hypothetical protein